MLKLEKIFNKHLLRQISPKLDFYNSTVRVSRWFHDTRKGSLRFDRGKVQMSDLRIEILAPLGPVSSICV